MPKITYTRPHLYEKQRRFVDDSARTTAVEASTKSGKTVACIVWIYEQALQGRRGDICTWTAPVYSQTKIAFRRLKHYISDKRTYTANESELTIEVINGVRIKFQSGDKPDSLYGDDSIAAVIDEASRCKKEVFYAVRSTLTATGGKLKAIGNVRGIDNWHYELCRMAEKDNTGSLSYHKLTANDAIEGGIFDKNELEEAKKILPEEVFNELYMAEAFDDRGKPFIWGFDDARNICEEYKPDELLPVVFSFDFNIDPITATVHQHSFDKQIIRTFHEYRLRDSNIYNLCDAIKADFNIQYYNVLITGDPSGRARSAMVKQNLNYFKIIKKELHLGNACFKVPGVAPGIRNSRILTSSLYSRHPDCKITKNCKHTIDDVKYTQTTPEGAIDKKNKERSHLMDTLRYYHWQFHRDFIKNYG